MARDYPKIGRENKDRRDPFGAIKLRKSAFSARIEAEWRAEGAAISSVNLGEVLYIRMRGTDRQRARADVAEARSLLTVIDPDWPMVAMAAEVKAAGSLSYADAFCVSVARHLEAPIWTGDPEILEQAGRHGCEIIDLR